jgi:predicted nucleotidyltransferase
LLHAIVLDHYYLRLRNGCYAVVVGNYHEYHMILSYIKYCPSRTPSVWRDRSGFLERVVSKYDASEVRKTSLKQAYIPFYDSNIPYVASSDVVEIYNPVKRAGEIIMRVNDELEATALGMIGTLLEAVKPLTIGVTGSLLPSIHNPKVSDIDLILYGWGSSPSAIEFVSENKDLFPGFTGGRLEAWAEANASATGLTRQEVMKFYRRYRRGVYSGREYSIMYSSGLPSSLLNKPYYKTLGVSTIQTEFEGGVHALDYPARGLVSGWRILEGVQPPMDICEVLSFEALYIPLFYEGGRAIVKGLLQCSVTEGCCRILVGGYEYKGFAKWAE